MSDRDKSPSRDSSGSDTDFKMIKCGQCRERTIGKSMWRCAECEELICQSCDLIRRGCQSDEDGCVCRGCFEFVFKNKYKYCTDSNCPGCYNKSPQFHAARQRENEQYEKFKADTNILHWKRYHPAINYPGKYKGRYLIDLFFSSDSFERGYIDWLIREGDHPPKPQYSKEQNENFQKYVKEAHDLKTLVSQTKLGNYRLRAKE